MTGQARGDQVALLASADRLIGARLRAFRRARGLTQAALGEVGGVASQQVAKYETGENAIGAARLWLLARALGVAPGVFFEGMDRLLAADEAAGETGCPAAGEAGGAASAGAAEAAGAPRPDAVTRALEAQQDGVQLADIFRRISNRRTRELLLTLSRELAKNS